MRISLDLDDTLILSGETLNKRNGTKESPLVKGDSETKQE